MIVGFTLGSDEGFYASQWFGFLVMIVALSLIFFGMKRYRDSELGGLIRFGPAFLLGLSIAAIAGVAYVAVWEVYLAFSDYEFINTYTAGIIEAKKAEGLSGAALAEEIARMDELKSQYGNPLFRLPITFMEIFPIGFLIALMSAAILRKPNVLPAHS